MRVDFATPRGVLSFDDLLFAAEQSSSGAKPVADLGKLRGRVVLLTRVDTKAKTIPLAASRLGSPGELFAAAIATMQNQSFIQRAPVWAELIVVAVLAILGCFVPKWTRFGTVAAGFVSLAAYVLIAMAVFNRWLIWLPGIMPAGAVLCFILFRIVSTDTVPKPKKPVIL
jgi:hypothetical protein